MRKLKLDLDQLAVDSFDTASPAPKGGTVFGEQCTCYTNCTCPGCPTCYATCNGQATCANTCANTCDDYTCAASCNGTCVGCGTDWTDCDCADTCMQTACGPYFCCA